ncbi:hypothetical protein [Parvularcula lutaonensis]|uniref:CPBP family intramembrane metalloprotease n=1 Tax=Parvularcula lutaonensis TaxID=491923 RepID=A0ABV7M810_9PROT|nr:hypothetical protein [Parvularcula lutaonensis]GGY43329.1 hypothetical protein GCM10007148_10070 [Parvularcula lutaonensis]
MSWPVSVLTNPNARALPFIGTAWACATIPALIIVLALEQVVPAAWTDAANEAIIPENVPPAMLAFGFVVFAPIVETAFMAVLYAILGLFRLPVRVQIGVTILLAAIAHGAQAIMWAAGPAWIFFILAVVWFTKRQKSWGEAFAFTTIVHALNNAVPSVGLFFPELAGTA